MTLGAADSKEETKFAECAGTVACGWETLKADGTQNTVHRAFVAVEDFR